MRRNREARFEENKEEFINKHNEQKLIKNYKNMNFFF